MSDAATPRSALDIATDVEAIADEMVAAIVETQVRYGPGMLVEYQLGTVGRGNTNIEPDLLHEAAKLLREQERKLQAIREWAEKYGRYMYFVSQATPFVRRYGDELLALLDAETEGEKP